MNWDLMRRMASNKGMAPMKTLFLFFVIMLVLAFTVQIFMVYNICNTVNTSVRRTVMSVAASNKQRVFSSLREGSTFCAEVEKLITVPEIERGLTDELGLTEHGGALEKLGSSGESFYTIRNIGVTVNNSDSLDRDVTLTYDVTFTLDVPVASFWDFGVFSIPMNVSSNYTAKY